MVSFVCSVILTMVGVALRIILRTLSFSLTQVRRLSDKAIEAGNRTAKKLSNKANNQNLDKFSKMASEFAARATKFAVHSIVFLLKLLIRLLDALVGLLISASFLVFIIAFILLAAIGGGVLIAAMAQGMLGGQYAHGLGTIGGGSALTSQVSTMTGGGSVDFNASEHPAPGTPGHYNAAVASIAAFAIQHKQYTYELGKTGPDRYDCTGFVSAVANAAGFQLLPPQRLSNTTQYNMLTSSNPSGRMPTGSFVKGPKGIPESAIVKTNKWSDLKPGDLIYNKEEGHAAIFMGMSNGQPFIAHASKRGANIAKSTSNPFSKDGYDVGFSKPYHKTDVTTNGYAIVIRPDLLITN